MTPPSERAAPRRVPAIIVHGGAGGDSTREPVALRDGMTRAVTTGWRVLAEGGRALDAVEAAVRVLEDHPRFNAGRGSVLTTEGTVELDASIMEGDQLRCGAVAAVTGIPNPISLARRIAEDGRHVLLMGEGARIFARAAGVLECDPRSLVVERPPAPTPGTVGAVALDAHGTIAAATSTGGISGKLPGRVGDSAVIGAGTYADSTIGGVSCTGSGEGIIRVVLARRALDYLKEADDPTYAARVAIDLLVDEGRGEGGLILLDWRGRTGYAHCTRFMPVAWMSPALAAPSLIL